MSIENELKRIRPSLEQCSLGQFSVLVYKTVVPAFDMTGLVLPISETMAVEVLAKDSYDPELALFLLSEADKATGEMENAGAIIEISVEFPDPYKFDSICIAPPKVAKRFEGESEELSEHLFWVFPAYKGEFPTGSDNKYFVQKITRKDNEMVSVVRWDRAKNWTRIQSKSTPKLKKA